MRKTCILLLSLLVMGACTNKFEQIATFDIKVESVSSTRATISVQPENNDVWYSFVLVTDGSMESLIREEYVIEATIKRCEEIYDFIKQSQADYATFEDCFFYNGPRVHSFDKLDDGKHHKVLFFQVNPVTHEQIGDYISVEFETPAIVYSDLTIEFSGQGDWLFIRPSNREETYLWDFERTDIIEKDYGLSEYIYLYSLAQMYHEYGFLDSKISRGLVEIDFTKLAQELVEEQSYTFCAAGIDKRGEFTTVPTSVEVIYHGKKGIEVIYPRY